MRVLKLRRPGKDKASCRVMGAQDESFLGCFASDYLGSREGVPPLIFYCKWLARYTEIR